MSIFTGCPRLLILVYERIHMGSLWVEQKQTAYEHYYIQQFEIV